MPWTVGDVEKHKKGLTDAQKKQWCKIANSVLQSCISDGGSDKTCAPSAIRQANGVVGNSSKEYFIFTYSSIAGYTVKEVQHLGKKHLIVPVVMMVEGVHTGSHGSLLHKIEDLGKYPAVWNGIPIVIDHPEEDGQSISANEPGIIEERKVGTVYHTQVKGKKLKAEAWLDEAKLRQVSSDVLANVKASEPVEVSVGVYADEDEEDGEFNGEEYSAIARNHRPDHLALLPGGVGACSLEDGCGLRANSSNKKEGGKNEMIRTDKLLKSIQSLKESGHALLDIIDNTSEGLIEQLDAVRNKINSLDSNDSYHFVHEVYDDYVVYESRLRVGESKIYKQNYSFNSGVVELMGDPVQVHKKVEYVVVPSVNKFVRTKPVKNKEVLNMLAEKCTPCVEKKVTTLIGNSQGFTEDDRDVLQGLSEVQLDKLLVKKEEKPIVHKEKDKPMDEEKPEAKPAVNALSKEDQDTLAFGKKQLAEKRAEYVKGIQANTEKEVWSDEKLNSMDIDTLERVFKSTRKEDENDYSMNGESRKQEINNNEADLEPLLPADCKPAVK